MTEIRPLNEDPSSVQAHLTIMQSVIQRMAENSRSCKLDFTQNPGKVMDDITFVRSHWWLGSVDICICNRCAGPFHVIPSAGKH